MAGAINLPRPYQKYLNILGVLLILKISDVRQESPKNTEMNQNIITNITYQYAKYIHHLQNKSKIEGKGLTEKTETSDKNKENELHKRWMFK